MRIACLQFAPKVGEVNNNLNRADAVLNRADLMELEGVDLLVLPELAFTGYNFPSLRAISPFLEHAGSGITSLWARTTALKYNCTVCVGYPEKADVSKIRPTGPEYYNSAIVVNGDGETVANYRKAFLYATDEVWALEGKEGFLHEDIPDLGSTVIGICTDLNPYKLEAQWNAFEFGFHILNVKANLVIVSMSWMTKEDGRLFSRLPQDPDLESLTYWVRRLEPLIRAEQKDEIIVVFCNRSGSEGDALYCGTSAVIGIKDGEVLVYGLLGRGNKEVLIVDTVLPPFAKLVQKLELQSGETETADDSSVSVSISDASSELDNSTLPSTVTTPTTTTHSIASPGLSQTKDVTACSPSTETGFEVRVPDAGTQAEDPKVDQAKREMPRLKTGSSGTPASPSTPSAMSPLSTGTMSPVSPGAQSATGRRKPRPKSPRIQIPYTPSLDEISSAIALSAGSSDCSVAGSMISPGIPTPSHPSPIPPHLRPKVDSYPASPAVYQHKATPYPGEEIDLVEYMKSPTTPFLDINEALSSPIFARPPPARNSSVRKDTPIEPGYSPISPWSPWSASSNYTARPSFKPLSSQLAITAMTSHLRSPAEARTPRPLLSERGSETTPQTPYTAVTLTAQPLTAIPLTAVPHTAVPLTAVPTTAVQTTAVPTQFFYDFPRPHNPNEDRPETPKAKELPTVKGSPPAKETLKELSKTLEASISSSQDQHYGHASSGQNRGQAPRVEIPRPSRDVSPEDVSLTHWDFCKSRGVIPIIASPSILDSKSECMSTEFSESLAKATRKSKARRSQSQQPTHRRNGRGHRRSRSLADARASRRPEANKSVSSQQ